MNRSDGMKENIKHLDYSNLIDIDVEQYCEHEGVLE